MPKLKKRKFCGSKRKYVWKRNQSSVNEIEKPDAHDTSTSFPVNIDHTGDHSYSCASFPVHDDSTKPEAEVTLSLVNMDHWSSFPVIDETPNAQDTSSSINLSDDGYLSTFDHDYSSTRMPEVSDTSDELPQDISIFERLQQDIQMKLGSPYVPVLTEDNIEILELYKAEGKTAIKLTINIDRTFLVYIHVHRKKLPQDHDVWNSLPDKFDTYDKVDMLLSRLNKFVVCVGNPDEDYQDLAPVGAALTSGKSAEIYAYREGDFCAALGNLLYHSTIRAVNCTMLVEGRRCSNCASYRRCLRARKDRMVENLNPNKDLVHGTYRHKDMSRQMLISKIEQQRSCLKTMQHTIDKQRRDIDRQILKCGVSVPDHQNLEMSDLLSVCREDMEKAFPDPNSLQRLLWDQQLKFAKSGKNGMRWHPMIIKWCCIFATNHLKPMMS